MSVIGSGLLRNRNPHFLSHPDQVSYGVRCHFSHELAAMDLDGCFACSDGVGYLFAQEARNDPRQHFSFTRCQRFEALPQHRDFSVSLAPGPIPFQRELNRIQQILLAERFGEKLYGSRLHGSHSHGNVAVRTYKDDRNMNVSLGQLVLEIEPTDPWQPDVEDETTGCIRTLAYQELLCGPEQLDLQTYRSDEALDRTTNRGIVIDNENDGCGLVHEAVFPLVGRMNWKRLRLSGRWFELLR